jgi:hypothetical protein
MAESTDKSVGSPQEEAKKEKKSKKVWTLEKCLKAAKRFSSRDDWSKNAPSSYKSASSHQWIEKCCAHMKDVATPDKISQKVKKSA